MGSRRLPRRTLEGIGLAEEGEEELGGASGGEGEGEGVAGMVRWGRWRRRIRVMSAAAMAA